MNEFIGIGKAKKMQEAIRPYLGQPGTAKQPEAGDERFIDVDRLIQIARRQAKLVVLFAAIGLLLGVTRLVFATYYYTAGTSVLIDDNLSRFAGDVSPAPANMESDKKIMSQVAILRSSSLAAKVVDRQQLYEKHEFVNPPLSVTQQIKGLAKMAMDVFAGKGTEMADADSLDARKGAAVAVLMENLRVEQQPQSFVIDLYYTSTDPTLSAQIANAYAEAYLSDKLDANFDASQRATVWLRARLTDLKDQSQEAALKVERYRTENGLTSAKGALCRKNSSPTSVASTFWPRRTAPRRLRFTTSTKRSSPPASNCGRQCRNRLRAARLDGHCHAQSPLSGGHQTGPGDRRPFRSRTSAGNHAAQGAGRHWTADISRTQADDRKLPQSV
ncbi:hypothetical protein AJ87_44285 [Rhizobium yanglingense]|nr:hypothetical protein AJ87_44285 [Rhizobium yanglingense]